MEHRSTTVLPQATDVIRMSQEGRFHIVEQCLATVVAMDSGAELIRARAAFKEDSKRFFQFDDERFQSEGGGPDAMLLAS